MKKLRKILVIISIFLIAGCASKNGYDENKNYIKELNNINNFIKLYEDVQTSVVVIGQTTCSHCINFKPTVNKIAFDKKIDIYWMEYDKLNGNDRRKLAELNENFESISTPYTIFIKNNEIVDELIGETSYDTLEAKIENNNIK